MLYASTATNARNAGRVGGVLEGAPVLYASTATNARNAGRVGGALEGTPVLYASTATKPLPTAWAMPPVSRGESS